MDIVTGFMIIILALILLWQMKPAPKGTFYENSFSLAVSKGIQGFFALLIIAHHVYIFLNTRGIAAESLQCFEHAGVLLIGFFFFCSGYGLIISFHTKQNYLKGFVVKRVLIVLVPFFICNYAYLSVELLLGSRFRISELIAAFFGVLLLNSQMWFAVEIMCLYLIFYLLFSHVKDEKCSIAIIVLIIVGMSALTMLNCRSYELSNWYWGEWWYNTTMLFPIGMIVAEKKDLLRSLAVKHYRILLMISFVGFTIFRLLSNRELHLRGYWTMKMMDKVQAYLLQVPSVIFFVMLLVLILLKVRVGNPLLDFLGKFSLEIILVNGVFLRLFLGIMQTYGLVCYLCLTFVGTILSAVLLYKLKRSILELK